MVESYPPLIRGACTCGTCTFEIAAALKSRLMCHCTICQAFTGNAYSDVAIVLAGRVRLHGEENISFRRYKRFRFPPPNLNRGRCSSCGQPVVETVGPAWMRVMFLPAANFERPELLPAVEGHLFYEHRRRDADDRIPKHCGYVDSQFAVAGMIMHAL